MSIAPCEICTGNAGIFTHYLTVGSSVTEVFPLGFMDTSLIDEVQNNGIAYRRKFSGVLTFVNLNGDDDFDLLYAVEIANPCTKIIYTIKKDGVDYWAGYFSTTDGKFDLDKCTFEVTPLVDDDYSALLENTGIQANILSEPTVVTTTAVLGLINQAYTRNRWLIDVIELLAGVVKPGVTVSSDFFTAATNPATLADNHLLYLTIAQKSDIIRPNSTDPATTAMMSWDELMEILWGMFQVTWDYDAGTDTINVEHISWWSAGVGLDLRTQEISKGSNKYSYQKEAMPKFEKFSFAEADKGPFVGVPIWYDSKCVDPDPETNTVETVVNVTTDLEYIYNNPDAISDEGFVILCNYVSGGNYFVEVQLGAITGTIALNCHLSWENLHHNYFKYNRVLVQGYMNSVLTDFYTIRKNKIQDIFAIVCPSDAFDPSDEITTELGETWFGGQKGKVKTAQLSPSGEMKLTLMYGEEGTEPTPVPEAKYIYVYEEKGSNKTTYTAIASENASADVTISIVLTLQDADSVTCDTASYDLVIPMGSNTGSVEIPWCVPVVDPATCIVVLVPDTSDATTQGWVVYIEYDPEAHC